MASHATNDQQQYLTESQRLDIIETSMSVRYPNTPLNIYLHQLVLYTMTIQQLEDVSVHMQLLLDLGLIDGAAGALDLINNIIRIKSDLAQTVA